MMRTRTVTANIIILAICLILVIVVYPRHIHLKLAAECEIYGGLTDALRDSELFEDMQSGKSFCFIGDSITKGSVIWDVSWYEPLKPYINGNIQNMAKGGWVVNDVLTHADRIPAAEVYVIAIGVNDIIRVEDADYAATGDEYVSRLQTLCEYISVLSPGAKIYIIAPWPIFTDDNGIITRSSEFTDALITWCNTTEYICIDPLPVIYEVMDAEGPGRFMYNSCHPNAPDGVGLFSYAVLQQEHLRRAGN